MKKFKVMALAMTVSMIATSIVSAVTVNAEDEIKGKGTVSSGYDLVYNKTKSTETSRCIDIYLAGTSNVDSINFNLNVTDANNVINEDQNGKDPVKNWQPNFSGYTGSYRSKNGIKAVTIASNKGTNPGVESFNGDYIGSIVLNVADASSEFSVSINTTKSYIYYNGTNKVTLDSEELDVPAYATAPVVPEPPVDTRAIFTDVVANPVGTLFDDDTTTVPVKAWVAQIDYEVEKLAEGASLAWKVEGAQKTIETASTTTVSGESVVLYGFAVAGRADQLESIGTVTLIAE